MTTLEALYQILVRLELLDEENSKEFSGQPEAWFALIVKNHHELLDGIDLELVELAHGLDDKRISIDVLEIIALGEDEDGEDGENMAWPKGSQQLATSILVDYARKAVEKE